MNPIHGFLLRLHSPLVFNPKVTPDPTESERLEAKLQEAAQQLAHLPARERHHNAMDGGHHAARR